MRISKKTSSHFWVISSVKSESNLIQLKYKPRSIFLFLRIENTYTYIKSLRELAGHHRRFIRNLAELGNPLAKLLKKDVDFQRTEEQQLAVDKFKEILTDDKILRYPDSTREFNSTADASNFAVGAVSSQGTGGKDLPIACASRTLNESETRFR